jgi:hypothetical protein
MTSTTLRYTDSDGRKIELVQTCSACPEQYDLIVDGNQCGYFRLRHGEFRVDYPYCGGETVYEAEPNGDGMFDSDERVEYLKAGIAACLKAMGRSTRGE